jgi:membrane-bound ClpP family serine protease
MKSAVACREIDQLLSAYVDHESSPDEAFAVEEHTRGCADCRERLDAMRRLDTRLTMTLERAADAASHTVRRPPLVIDDAPSAPWIGRLSTVAVVLVFAALAGVVLLRSAPAPQTVQTAAQPTAPALSGPIVGISIDGLVDPPTANYVHRAASLAQDENATLVVWLSPSGGLAPSVATVTHDLGTVSSYAYAPSPSTADATSIALAQSTRGNLTAIPAGTAWITMDLGEAVWHRLLDPTTAYLFFVLGLYAVFLELAHPGALAPGITGLISLGIAAVAFTSLPINWLGVAALIGGVALMALELKTSTHGLLLLAGIVCLAAGSVVLYALPGLLSPAVLLGVVLIGLVLGVLLARLAQRVRRLPPITTFGELVGARGVARSGLNPDGVVHVQGQMWSAHSRSGSVAAGEPVRVVARRGLVLDVESASFRAAATQKGA